MMPRHTRYVPQSLTISGLWVLPHHSGRNYMHVYSDRTPNCTRKPLRWGNREDHSVSGISCRGRGELGRRQAQSSVQKTSHTHNMPAYGKFAWAQLQHQHRHEQHPARLAVAVDRVPHTVGSPTRVPIPDHPGARHNPLKPPRRTLLYCLVFPNPGRTACPVPSSSNRCCCLSLLSAKPPWSSRHQAAQLERYGRRLQDSPARPPLCLWMPLIWPVHTASAPANPPHGHHLHGQCLRGPAKQVHSQLKLMQKTSFLSFRTSSGRGVQAERSNGQLPCMRLWWRHLSPNPLP